jgi:hypothetical protein
MEAELGILEEELDSLSVLLLVVVGKEQVQSGIHILQEQHTLVCYYNNLRHLYIDYPHKYKFQFQIGRCKFRNYLHYK